MTTQFQDEQFLYGHLLPGHWLDGAEQGAEAQADMDPEESALYSILVEVQRLIEAIGLEDSPAVRIRKLPVDQGIGIAKSTELPVVLVCPLKEDVLPDGPIGVDDIRYSVLCIMLAADNREGTGQDNLNRTLIWREDIRRTFNNKRLSAIAGCIRSDVQTQQVVSREGWAVNYLVCALLLNFTVRELHEAAA